MKMPGGSRTLVGLSGDIAGELDDLMCIVCNRLHLRARVEVVCFKLVVGDQFSENSRTTLPRARCK